MKKILYFWLVGFSIITYKAQTTTWNGSSWSNGTPNSNKNVIINGNYNAYKNIIARNFTVNPNFTYSIDDGGRLVIHGSVINNGTIVVGNDAVMVQVNNGSTYSGSGTMTVNRVAKLKRTDFNLWSSPVSGQNLYNFSAGTPKNTFFVYDEATDYFVTTGLSTTSVFQPGIGYSIKGKSAYSTTVPTTETFKFTGIPNNGDITIMLKRSSGEDKGYNLVGNPFPSNLNFRMVFRDTNTSSIFNKQWFWTNLNGPKLQQGSNYSGNNYATFVSKVGGVGPTYESNSVEEVTLRPTEITKVGQGFIVQAKYNNAPLTFKNNMRSLVATGSIFYNKNEGEDEPQEPEPIIDRYWLKLINPDNIANDILIAHIAEATNNYDEDYDAALYAMGNDTFYSAVGTNKLQIQARALPISDSDVIPLAYKTSKAGNCIIALNDKDGVFKDSNKAIYLKDKVTGTITNLQEGYYTFNSEVLTTPNDSRFEILYANSVLAADNAATNQWIVYKQDTDWVVRGNDRINGLDLYDASGKLVRSLAGNNAGEVRLSNVGLLKGLYVMKIKTGKGTVTKKLLN